MCGIFGLVKKFSNDQPKYIKNLIKEMFLQSFKRGQDGFGLFLNFQNLKLLFSSENSEFHTELENIYEKIDDNLNKKNYLTGFIGQTRLPIIGNINNKINSVPIKTKNIIGIHNGNIIFNDLDFSNLEFSEKSDSRILFEKIDTLLNKDKKNFVANLNNFLNSLNGEINISFYVDTLKEYFFFSNTGSFYYLHYSNQEESFFLFMSEFFFINEIKKFDKNLKKYKINNLKNSLMRLDCNNHLSIIS